jgi:hypothetical protein
MAYFGHTETAVHIDEIYSKKLQRARHNAYDMLNMVDRHDDDVAGHGDTIYINRIDTLESREVGDDGSVQPQGVTDTQATITMDQWWETTFQITDRALQQSVHDLRSPYADEAGKALSKRIELKLISLYSGLSTALTAVVDMDEDQCLLIVQTLDQALTPDHDRFAKFRSSQKRALYKISRLFEEQTRKGSGNQITSGKITMDIYGIQYSFTQLITSTGGEAKNLAWQRGAFALAISNHINMEKLARDGKRDTWSADELFGFAEVRDADALVCPTTYASGT